MTFVQYKFTLTFRNKTNQVARGQVIAVVGQVAFLALQVTDQTSRTDAQYQFSVSSSSTKWEIVPRLYSQIVRKVL